MAKKETIYVVSESDNTVIRASKNFLNALNFTTTLELGSFYLCTSEFGNLKKGDPMSNIVDFL